VLDLKPINKGQGTVVEAFLDKGKGYVFNTCSAWYVKSRDYMLAGKTS
jgi:hypothetical protein